jgi:hypothetical protein
MPVTEIYRGGVLIETLPEEKTLAEQKAARLQELADVRWNACQTFVYDGIRTAADSALLAVTGFVVAAQVAPPPGASTWKLGPGDFRQWTVEDVIAYGIAIREHVQACFDQEEALTAQIEAAETAEELAAIDLTVG